MKSRNLTHTAFSCFIALALGVFVMWGCGGEDDPTDPNTGNDVPIRTLVVTIDGDDIDFSEKASATTHESNYSVYSSVPELEQSIHIWIPSSPGTYDMNVSSEASVEIRPAGLYSLITSRDPGTLTLKTATDTRLVGSFSGRFSDGRNSHQVSGSFDVPLGE